ncbi:MAG: methyltransferase domain-containing protein [Anaerolineae bacterium]|nr:methyltransferase domain-containing protein [Anaerolineae bacterium]MDW8173977.1 methyltransferase domain-containing protein [Anaerolineae bacterium]
MERWLTFFKCSECGGSLHLSEVKERAADQHIMEGTLACVSCAATYPIKVGIPRFVKAPESRAVVETVQAFGVQWAKANQLVQTTGFSSPDLFLDFVAPVDEVFIRGKSVLDGGYGQGRFTLAAQRLGASLVVGVDLSDAVEQAFANTRHLDNVLIVQGDLMALPFAPTFDYAFSVGVLHHTADPRAGFAQLVSAVRHGGHVSAWVYGREGNDWVVNILNPIRQRITSRLPSAVLWWIALVLAVPLFLAIRLVYQPVERPERLSFLRRRLFYFDYLVWLGKYCGYLQQALVIHDHLTPSIAEYIPHGEFADWFKEQGLQDVIITSRANNSWRGFARKP